MFAIDLAEREKHFEKPDRTFAHLLVDVHEVLKSPERKASTIERAKLLV